MLIYICKNSITIEKYYCGISYTKIGYKVNLTSDILWLFYNVRIFTENTPYLVQLINHGGFNQSFISIKLIQDILQTFLKVLYFLSWNSNKLV